MDIIVPRKYGSLSPRITQIDDHNSPINAGIVAPTATITPRPVEDVSYVNFKHDDSDLIPYGSLMQFLVTNGIHHYMLDSESRLSSKQILSRSVVFYLDYAEIDNRLTIVVSKEPKHTSICALDITFTEIDPTIKTYGELIASGVTCIAILMR
jgi:hypothetical protein